MWKVVCLKSLRSGARGVAQAVAPLPSKHRALRSNPNTDQKNVWDLYDFMDFIEMDTEPKNDTNMTRF
jgi:hypothetical protein